MGEAKRTWIILLSQQNRRNFWRISGEQRRKRGECEARIACVGRIARNSRSPSPVFAWNTQAVPKALFECGALHVFSSIKMSKRKQATLGEFGRKQVVSYYCWRLWWCKALTQPEGLPAYKAQPTLPIDAASASPTSNVTEPAEQDQEGEAQEAQEDEELDPQTVSEREDKENDRTTDASLAGRQLRGLYEEGWNREVNLPSPYILSQFLPPPYFLSQFLPPP